MFLGVFINDKMKLNSRGWGIMVGWTSWLVFFIILIEALFFVLYNRGRKLKI